MPIAAVQYCCLPVVVCLCSLLLLPDPGLATEPPGHARIAVSGAACGGEANVSASGLAALAHRNTATVSIDGATYTVSRDHEFGFPDYPSWIGWSEAEAVALVVTESPLGHQFTVLRNGTEYRGTVAQWEEPAFVATDAELQAIADAHRLAVRLALHRADRVHLNRFTGRIETLRGSDIAQVRNGRLVLSSTFLETLGLTEQPQFDPASPPGKPHRNRVSRDFKQRIFDIPVNVYIHVEYYDDSGDVRTISGPVLSTSEAPAPAASDTTASQAVTLLREFAKATLGDSSVEAIDMSPLKREYQFHKGSLLLGWSGRVTVGAEQFLIFLDAKTGEVLHGKAERRHQSHPANRA